MLVRLLHSNTHRQTKNPVSKGGWVQHAAAEPGNTDLKSPLHGRLRQENHGSQVQSMPRTQREFSTSLGSLGNLSSKQEVKGAEAFWSSVVKRLICMLEGHRFKQQQQQCSI